MRKLAAGVSLALATLATMATTPAATLETPGTPALLKAAQAQQPAALALLEKLVNIDSGTFNAKGLDAVGAIAAAELARQGFRIEKLPATPAAGHNLVATRTGTGKGRVLLVAHLDTVFADGTAAKRPFRVEGRRAYGPGIMDDKGGIVVAVHAAGLLGEQDFGKLTILLNTNEETGSEGTRALIDRLAREHDVAFNLEPGRAADGLVVARKGSGEIELDVAGKASHAGVAPKQGVNAALEAAHQVVQLSRLGDDAKETTVSWTVIQGGDRSNVIPDHAKATADVRVKTPDEFDRVERDLRRLAANQLVPDAKVAVVLKRGFPPMAASPVTDGLAQKATAVYAEIGRKLTLESSGGAADASLVFAAGLPTLDGLGIVGGGIHTADEYAEVDSIAPRIYLLARLVQEYGRSPAVRRP
ncbi:MAG TPA: glutamate carboxypeptidase [Pseudoduganella sp.]